MQARLRSRGTRHKKQVGGLIRHTHGFTDAVTFMRTNHSTDEGYLISGGDDVLKIGVSSGDPMPQTEGVGNKITFRVSANKPLTAQATVDLITVDGTAAGGLDYTKIDPAQQIIIPVAPGYVDVAVNLLGPIVGWAPDRFFSVQLSNPGGNAGGDTPILGSSIGVGGITDSLPEPTISISALGNPDPAEQNVVSTQTFTVTLSGIATYDVAIFHRTRNGSAMAGQDYTAIVDKTAIITAGQLTIDIPVTILAGSTVIAVEDYFLDILSATTNGHTLTVTNATGMGRIQEENYLPAPTNLVAAGQSGNIQVTWTDGAI